MSQVPMAFPGWRGEDVGALPAEVNVLPADVTIWRRRYRKENSETVVEVSAVLPGAHPKASLHQPEICFVAQGWEPISREIVEISVPTDGEIPLRFVRLVLVRGPARQVAYYWFQGQGQSSPDRIAGFWSAAKRRFLTGTSERWALVRIAVPSEEGWEDEAMDLLHALAPYLLGGAS